ncbi:MAG: YjgN family protein [Aquabacterium sp.]
MFDQPPSPLDQTGVSPLISGNASGQPRPFSVHAIEFTGSGSEYFRIWIVNLLLMVVTLGLYYPWAKVRKLRYFYGNTMVAGHPLDFHGNPRKMMRGFLLVSVLMVLYSAAGRVSDTAGFIALIIVALLWPALMRSSLQFRLANTSWRGLRFAFNGSLKDAYMVMLVPAGVMIGLFILSVILIAMLGGSRGERSGLGQLIGMAPIMIGFFALGPYVWWRIKRYQHANYALGPMQTQFRASYKRMLGVFMKTGLLSMLCMVVALAVVGVVMGASVLSDPAQAQDKGAAMLKVMLPIFVLLMLLAQLIQVPYFTSRMQNLVWTETGNRMVRFKSNLELWPLMWLTFKNWALTLLTLGLYWPFAAVALARARLQAIVIHSRQDPDQLVALSRAGRRDAAGDMAADMIGIDFGI